MYFLYYVLILFKIVGLATSQPAHTGQLQNQRLLLCLVRETTLFFRILEHPDMVTITNSSSNTS